MSTEADVMVGVRRMLERVKQTLRENLSNAVNNGHITIEPEKLPGLNQIVEGAVDQGFIEGSELLTNTLQAYSKRK